MTVPATFRGVDGLQYEIHREVVAVLIRRAQQNLSVEYDHLKRACGLRPNDVGWILGSISEWTSKRFHNGGFPIFLSAFVVNKSTRYPGGDFLRLTRIPRPYRRSRHRNAPLSPK